MLLPSCLAGARFSSRVCRYNLHRHHRSVRLVRYSYRHDARVPPELQAWSVQAWRRLQIGSGAGVPVDRFRDGCLLPTDTEPGDQPDVQLHTGSTLHCRRLRVRQLVFVGTSLVHREV